MYIYMDLLLDGINDHLKVNATKITITRKKLTSLVTNGFKGTNIVPLSAVSGVKFKPATYLLSGNLEITIVVDTKTSKEVIRFKASENDAAEQIAAFIEQTNAGKQFYGTIKFDSAEELPKYEQLLKADIINQEEFDYLQKLLNKIAAKL